jgi:hypothetical protein
VKALVNKRLIALLALFSLVLCLYAVIRLALNIPADKQGHDAMDYVSLHGNIQFETNPGDQVRPTDVTGVYIVEGSANQTMIRHLEHLPNLQHIAIGPDFRLLPIGTPAKDLPKLTEQATLELKRMQAAFPTLEIRLVEPNFPSSATNGPVVPAAQ